MIDTTVFDKLCDWLTFGDVSAQCEWAQLSTPDERYEINVTWKFRGKPVGTGNILIEPIWNTSNYSMLWLLLEWIPEWQSRGLYGEVVKGLMDRVTGYGITRFVAAPADSTAESILASAGFEWVGHEFVLDLQGERVKQWRAYKDGVGPEPSWR